MIKLIYADDHSIILQGLGRMFREAEDIQVLGGCNCGTDALEMIRKLKPDVAMLDISMPDMDGITVAEQLQREGSSTRLVLLTMHDMPPLLRRAKSAGVKGYVLKDDPFEDLLTAIRIVASGGSYMSARIAHLAGQAPERKLTKREKEILTLVVDGHSNRQIAERLGLSVKTVDTHRTNLMNKLDIHNTADLVRYAMKIGIGSI